MDRGIKNWMFVSVALALVEVGRLVGGEWHGHVIEHILDLLALASLVVMIGRYVMIKLMR